MKEHTPNVPFNGLSKAGPPEARGIIKKRG
jgi:hypothetical protein